MVDFSQLEGFDWDEGNIDKNVRKHRVHFRECEEVFESDPVFFHDEPHSQHEERFVVLGESSEGRRLTVVFTVRDRRIRVISARDMSREERITYAEEKAA